MEIHMHVWGTTLLGEFITQRVTSYLSTLENQFYMYGMVLLFKENHLKKVQPDRQYTCSMKLP